MTTLIEFLTARLDEREAAALAAGGQKWTQPGQGETFEPALVDDRGEVVVYDEGSPTRAQAELMAMHDPAWVLRDVTAKRAIVQLHDVGDPCDAHDPISLASVPCDTLHHLAAVYCDHPDYDESWEA